MRKQQGRRFADHGDGTEKAVYFGHFTVVIMKKQVLKGLLFKINKSTESYILIWESDFQNNNPIIKYIAEFELTLPPARSDLAQELTKDPYNCILLGRAERLTGALKNDMLVSTKF